MAKTEDAEGAVSIDSTEPAAPAAEAPAEGAPATNAVYIGTADIKRLTAENFAAVGIESPGGTWSRENDFTISFEILGAAAVEFIKTQPDFTVR